MTDLYKEQPKQKITRTKAQGQLATSNTLDLKELILHGL